MMKSKLAIMMLSSLLVLSLTACGDVSTGTILDSEEEEQEIQVDETEDDAEGSSETTDIGTEETQEDDSEDDTTGNDPTNTGIENGPVASETNTIEGSSNQYDAVSIETDQDIDGTVSSKQWFSFTTGSDPNPKYQITITNKTASSDRLDANLKEQSGDDICWTSAYSDGTSASMTADKLDPDTTYYICISPHKDETIDFHMVIHDLTETANAN